MGADPETFFDEVDEAAEAQEDGDDEDEDEGARGGDDEGSGGRAGDAAGNTDRNDAQSLTGERLLARLRAAAGAPCAGVFEAAAAEADAGDARGEDLVAALGPELAAELPPGHGGVVSISLVEICPARVSDAPCSALLFPCFLGAHHALANMYLNPRPP